ncbi:MAG: hypothetical protein AB8B56_07000, partial [Crocinitomicaceae bacterium]
MDLLLSDATDTVRLSESQGTVDVDGSVSGRSRIQVVPRAPTAGEGCTVEIGGNEIILQDGEFTAGDNAEGELVAVLCENGDLRCFVDDGTGTGDGTEISCVAPDNSNEPGGVDDLVIPAVITGVAATAGALIGAGAAGAAAVAGFVNPGSGGNNNNNNSNDRDDNSDDNSDEEESMSSEEMDCSANYNGESFSLQSGESITRFVTFGFWAAVEILCTDGVLTCNELPCNLNDLALSQDLASVTESCSACQFSDAEPFGCALSTDVAGQHSCVTGPIAIRLRCQVENIANICQRPSDCSFNYNGEVRNLAHDTTENLYVTFGYWATIEIRCDDGQVVCATDGECDSEVLALSPDQNQADSSCDVCNFQADLFGCAAPIGSTGQHACVTGSQELQTQCVEDPTGRAVNCEAPVGCEFDLNGNQIQMEHDATPQDFVTFGFWDTIQLRCNDGTVLCGADEIECDLEVLALAQNVVQVTDGCAACVFTDASLYGCSGAVQNAETYACTVGNQTFSER